MKRHGHIGTVLLFILGGPLVWAAHLFAVYGAHALVCARLPAQAGALPVLLGGLTAAALGILALALWRLELPAGFFLGGGTAEPEFLTALMRLLAPLSLFGVIWAALAILTVPECSQLR